MSVLIKGMDMPTSCAFCRFNGTCCYAKGDEDAHSTLSCPLVPVPPHGRLIDADKMKESIKNQLEVLMHFGDNDLKLIAEVLKVGFLQEIDNAPTIIQADEGE